MIVQGQGIQIGLPPLCHIVNTVHGVDERSEPHARERPQQYMPIALGEFRPIAEFKRPGGNFYLPPVIERGVQQALSVLVG